MPVMPIPNDWDGESWCRWAICWPDSVLWNAILWGFVTTPSRGRFWDERTGTITEAQAIGEEIITNNKPLEEVAMSCSEANHLAKTNLLLIAALTGQQIDLSAIPDLETYLNQNFDYRLIGVANRIGPEVEEDSSLTIQATLASLQTALEALTTALETTGATGEDLEDDLAKIWRSLDDITTILGGSVSDPPTPL